MIELDNVSKIYDTGAKGVLHANISIAKGEFVFIVGASGSGKSTIMRLLLKELEPSEGTITVNNLNLANISAKQMPYYRRKIGVVFQDYKLLKNKTVYDNVAFAMQIVEASGKDIRRNVPAVLSMVDLQRKARSFPTQLSGGEQQRVALARAIVNNPPLLLADEPTGNLDPENAWGIMSLLEEINERGTTIVIATHAKDIVDQMQKRVITLNKGVILSDKERGTYSYEED